MPDLDGMGGWGVALRGVAPVVDLAPDGVLIGLLQADPLDQIPDDELAPIEIKDLPFAIVAGVGVSRTPGTAGRAHPDILLPNLPIDKTILLQDNLLPRLAWLPNRDDVNTRVFSDGPHLSDESKGVLSDARGWFKQLSSDRVSKLPNTGRWAMQLHEEGVTTTTDKGILTRSVLASEY